MKPPNAGKIKERKQRRRRGRSSHAKRMEVPQGQPTIARRFNGGSSHQTESSPAGTKENTSFPVPFLPPLRGLVCLTFYPQLKLRAILGCRSATFTEPAVRGGAGGRGSNGSRRRRWCRQKEIAASAIQRGRRKRPH